MTEYLSTITIDIPDKELHDKLLDYLCTIAFDYNQNSEQYWHHMQISDKQDFAPGQRQVKSKVKVSAVKKPSAEKT